MVRSAWIAMLGLCMAACAVAQEAGPMFGPGFLPPEVARLPAVPPEPEPAENPTVRRLPPIESEVGPIEEIILPERDSGKDGDPAASPSDGSKTKADARGEAFAPDTLSDEKLWAGSFELGLAGAEGNNETMNFRFACGAKRKTPDNVLSVDLSYRKQTERTQTTANRLYLDCRDERLFPESRWTCFVHETTEYDEFQSFDTQVAGDLGIGYRVIKTDTTNLVLRCGSGVSHKFGGPDQRYVPEAVFGWNLESQLSKRQRLTFSTEYAPDITAFGEYRIQSQAAWELLLDRETNLSVKLSAIDRYDNPPNGVRPNDLDYAATILWKF